MVPFETTSNKSCLKVIAGARYPQGRRARSRSRRRKASEDNWDMTCEECQPQKDADEPCQMVSGTTGHCKKCGPTCWLCDSGACMHLIGASEWTSSMGTVECKPIELCTANGLTVCKQKCKHAFVPSLNLTVQPLLLQNAPAVISLGRRFEDEGFEFFWKKGQCQLKKSKIDLVLVVDNYVPYIVSGDKCKGTMLPFQQGGGSSSGGGGNPRLVVCCRRLALIRRLKRKSRRRCSLR